MPLTLAQPRWDINHVLAYGQSLASGFEGWPALSLTQPYDSLMLGDSVRPLHDSSVQWRPVGGARFQPLVATVQNATTGARLTPAEIAALPRGALAPGETVLEGAVNTWRGRMLSDPATRTGGRLLASACGVGARTLEALSMGASPDLFGRLRQCVALARATATSAGRSYGVAALLLLHGEHNSRGFDGGTTDRLAYRDLLRRFYRDCRAELAAGQDAPALFLYQTGGDYASDSLSVAQAQVEFGLATPGCFLVAPSYPVTAKGGHLDANGYRWLGAQFGKVMHRVLTLDQEWRPLHPLAARVAGHTVTVDFHVPVPPLAWGRVCADHRLTEIPDRGFSVTDAAGAVPVTSVELDGAVGVRLRLGRATDGATTLRYADRRHGGRGNLRDSDPDVAADVYQYDATTGHYPGADIAELVGRPYDLRNWCVAFAIPVAPVVAADDGASVWQTRTTT